MQLNMQLGAWEMPTALVGKDPEQQKHVQDKGRRLPVENGRMYHTSIPLPTNGTKATELENKRTGIRTKKLQT